MVSRAHPALEIEIRNGGIGMGLARDRTACVYAPPGHAPASGGHGPWRDVYEHVRRGRVEASDRGAWADTQISCDEGRAGIGHRRGAQDREAARREEVWLGGLRPCRLEGGRRKKRGERDHDEESGRQSGESERLNDWISHFLISPPK